METSSLKKCSALLQRLLAWQGEKKAFATAVYICLGDIITSHLNSKPGRDSGSADGGIRSGGQNQSDGHDLCNQDTGGPLTSQTGTRYKEYHQVNDNQTDDLSQLYSLPSETLTESKVNDLHAEVNLIDKEVKETCVAVTETQGEAPSSEMSWNWSGRSRGRGRNDRRGYRRGNVGTGQDFEVEYLTSQMGRTSVQNSRDFRRDGGAASSSGITSAMWRVNDFPFFTDRETVRYIHEAKIMFIMRGLPGSGKSTIVKMISEIYSDAVCCSADDFFLRRDGTYQFDRNQLSSAHETCQGKARQACEDGCSVVIIDNTNVKIWEMRNYVNLASNFSYTVIAVQPKTSWKFNPVELAKKNKHGLDAQTIRQRLSQFEEGIPFYYGWFLSEKYSDIVRDEANKIFKSCQVASHDFSNFISSLTFNPVQGRGKTNMSSIYGRGDSSTSTLHCTSCFTNRGKAHSASAYHNDPAVKAGHGSVYTLEIIGFVFTAQTAGARIRLDDTLLTLWDKDDEEGLAGYRGGRGGGRSQLHRARSSRFRPVEGRGSRAHLTLGYTPGTKAVQTGLDLVQVVDLEQTNGACDESRELRDGILRCYDGTYWVVYLDESIEVKAMFSGRY